jgi:hypothetical protein
MAYNWFLSLILVLGDYLYYEQLLMQMIITSTDIHLRYQGRGNKSCCPYKHPGTIVLHVHQRLWPFTELVLSAGSHEQDIKSGYGQCT